MSRKISEEYITDAKNRNVVCKEKNHKDSIGNIECGEVDLFLVEKLTLWLQGASFETFVALLDAIRIPEHAMMFAKKGKTDHSFKQIAVDPI